VGPIDTVLQMKMAPSFYVLLFGQKNVFGCTHGRNYHHHHHDPWADNPQVSKAKSI